MGVFEFIIFRMLVFFTSHFVDSFGDTVYQILIQKSGCSNRSHHRHQINNEATYNWHVIKMNEFWNFHPTSSKHELHRAIAMAMSLAFIWIIFCCHHSNTMHWLCFVSIDEIDFSGFDMRFLCDESWSKCHFNDTMYCNSTINWVRVGNIQSLNIW